MLKVLIKKKNITYIVIAAILCALVLTFLHIGLRDKVTLEEAFLCARDGYSELGEKEYHADGNISTFNLIIALTIVLSTFCEDLDIAKSYIFVRIFKKRTWFTFKFLQLFIHCLAFSATYNTSMILLVVALGFKAESTLMVIKYLLFGIVAHLLTLFLIAMLGCILSFYFKPHLAVGAIVILLVSWIVASNYTPVEITQYNLIMNYFISWHTYYSVNVGYYSFPTWTYYLAMCLVITAELIAANKIIKKTDFI